MVPFTKQALSIKHQIQQLRERGLLIDDESFAEHCLRHYNYYRLGAYWLPFEADHSTHRFEEGASFRRVVDHYNFDRELRLLVMDALERIEVSVRSNWAHHVGLDHGAHAHLDQSLYINGDKWQHDVTRLKSEVERSSEVFVVHFRENYLEDLPPIWAVCEVMSMSSLSKWYKNFGPAATKKKISDVYGVDQRVLESWLHHLSIIRNICAHHSRLWNRRLTFKPKLPLSKQKQLRQVMRSDHRGLFNTLVILDHLLTQIAPEHDWKRRVNALILQYSIQPSQMGFPSDPSW